MNKYAAEKIASEYYKLGVQLALQNAGLLKTADPLDRYMDSTVGWNEFSRAVGGMNVVPYQRAKARDIADKYDISEAKADALSDKGKAAYNDAIAVRVGKALGTPNSQRVFNPRQGTARVPYRQR